MIEASVVSAPHGRPGFLLTASLALIGAALNGFAPSAHLSKRLERPMTAFRHVNVVTMDHPGVLQDQTVLISGDEIASIAPASATRIPNGARVIEAGGKYLFPGLVDFHSHPYAEELPSFLAYGDTTIVTLDGEGLAWPDLEARAAGTPLPNVISATRILDGVPPTDPRFYTIGSPDDVPAILDLERQRGAALVKVYTSLHEPEFRRVAQEARKRGMAVAGHIPRKLSMETVLVGGLNLVAHGEEFFQFMPSDATEAQIDPVVRMTAENGVALIPNLVAYVEMPRHAAALNVILQDPEIAYVSPATYHEWSPANDRYARRSNIAGFVAISATRLETLKLLTRKMHRAHVLLLAGTDAPVVAFPGVALLEEIGLLSQSGLGNYEALKTATVNPGLFAAKYMKGRKRFGAVEVGDQADLLLLGADPVASLDALKRLDGVMVKGRWWTPEDLSRPRERIKAAVRPLQAKVREFDRLVAGKEFDALYSLLDRSAHDGPFLEENTVMFDALGLKEKGRGTEAAKMLQHALRNRVTTTSGGLHKVLARLRVESGDPAGAKAEFEAALKEMPHDGVAQAGLAELAASQRN
ncbi:MAG TPA: amidohydrolase family protein [Thermoanaerobaculia bacterium]|nr:amidohydrolase family protein [Thermoanaerobaculia bacterium]